MAVGEDLFASLCWSNFKGRSCSHHLEVPSTRYTQFWPQITQIHKYIPRRPFQPHKRTRTCNTHTNIIPTDAGIHKRCLPAIYRSHRHAPGHGDVSAKYMAFPRIGPAPRRVRNAKTMPTTSIHLDGRVACSRVASTPPPPPTTRSRLTSSCRDSSPTMCEALCRCLHGVSTFLPKCPHP